MRRIFSTILSLKSKGFVLLFLAVAAFAQPPAIEWQRSITEEIECYGSDIIALPDSSFVVIGSGYASPGMQEDVIVSKVTPTGRFKSTCFYGMEINEHARAGCILSDGSIAVVGYVMESLPISKDILAMRISDSGVLQWTGEFGGNSLDDAFGIVASPNQELVLCGRSLSYGSGSYAAFVIRIDQNGDSTDSFIFDDQLDAGFYSISTCNTGGYLAVGAVILEGRSEEDVLVIRLSSDLEPQWTRTFGGPLPDRGLSVIETIDGSIAVAGRTQSFGASGTDMYLLVLSSTGDSLWMDISGGTGNDEARDIVELPDASLCIACRTPQNGSALFDATVRCVLNGDSVWQTTIEGSENDEANGIVRTPEGNLAIAGSTESYSDLDSDILFTRLLSDGTNATTANYGGENAQIGATFKSQGEKIWLASTTRSGATGTFNNMMITEFDSLGRLSWRKHYDSDFNDDLNDLYVSVNGLTHICGSRAPNLTSQSDNLLLEIDSLGNVQWETVFGSQYDEQLLQVLVLESGNTIAVAGSNSPVASDARFYEFDTNGNIIDEVTICTLLNANLTSIAFTGEYFLFSGRYTDSTGHAAVYLKATDSDWNEYWIRTYHGGWDQVSCKVFPASFGYYMIAPTNLGFTHDVILYNLDIFGDTLWTHVYPLQITTVTYAAVVTPDDDLLWSGATESGIVRIDYSGEELWTLQVNSHINGLHLTPQRRLTISGQLPNDPTNVFDVAYTFQIQEVNSSVPRFDPHVSNTFANVHPNPTVDLIHLEFLGSTGQSTELKIFDILGRMERELTIGVNSFGQTRTATFSLGNLSSGMYFLVFDNKTSQQTLRVMLLK